MIALASVNTTTNDGAMPLEMHLAELRARVIRVLQFMGANIVLSVFLTPKILELLKRPLGNIELQALSLEEPVMVLFKIGFAVAAILTVPAIANEAVNFMLPAMTKSERKLFVALSIAGPVLFVAGAFFAYAVILPIMFKFFIGLGGQYAQLKPHMDSYVSLVGSSMMILGLTFQLPVVALVLGHFQILSYRTILHYWRQAIVGCAVLAAVITPDPTAISMLIVMGALCALYALSCIALLLWQELPQRLSQVQSR